jgi:hypothetical protein
MTAIRCPRCEGIIEAETGKGGHLVWCATPSPAPAVGELADELEDYAYKLHCQEIAGTGLLMRAAARISQLEAALEAALPYVEAANRAEHLMDGFGPRSCQSSDDHVAAIRALLKGRS